MGDLLEIAQKNSPGASLFCQNATPQEQIEWGVELLEPIKDKILIMHGSNHERRVFKNAGVDITKNMARELGIAYAEYGAYTRILVGDQAYTIYSTHGKSGARTRESKMKILRTISTVNVGADAYIMGHVHTNDNSINPINQLDLKAKTVSIKEIVLVLSGHFLKYNNSYAEESNMSPEPPTAPIILLDGEEHKIHVTQLADVL